MPKFTKKQEMEFVGLLTDHQSLIRAFVISLLPGLPETEDVVQETNQVLWAKRESFELGTNFKAWALTTARFQVMALQKKLQRESRVPLDEDVLAMISSGVEERSAEAMNEKFSDLNQCLNDLPDRDRELVLHRYWKNSGLNEYSKATGRSEGALKVALYRVRSSLRDCLERRAALRGGQL